MARRIPGDPSACYENLVYGEVGYLRFARPVPLGAILRSCPCPEGCVLRTPRPLTSRELAGVVVGSHVAIGFRTAHGPDDLATMLRGDAKPPHKATAAADATGAASALPGARLYRFFKGVVIQVRPHSDRGDRAYIVAFKDGDVRLIHSRFIEGGRFLWYDEAGVRLRDADADAPAPVAVAETPASAPAARDDDDDDDDDECPVCLEDFDKRAHRRVVCPACAKPTCRACVRECIVRGSDAEAQCPGCHATYTRAFMRRNLTNSFVTGPFRRHRKRLLVDTEKARMPEAMPLVPEYRAQAEAQARRREQQGRVDRLTAQLTELRATAAYTETGEPVDPALGVRITRTAVALREAGTVLYHRRSACWNAGRVYERALRRARGEDPEQAAESRRAFRQACPREGCNGFLNPSWKCPVCEHWTCKDCLCVRGPQRDSPHECDPEALQSAELIKRETRNCPSCAAAIFKISGCDQMYCTRCHVAFSWRTGQRVHGRIHNPHFFEWRRAVERGEVPDAPAGGAGAGAGGGAACGAGEDNVPAVEIVEISLRSARQSLRRFLAVRGGTDAGVMRTAEWRAAQMVLVCFRAAYESFLHFRYDELEPLRTRNAAANDNLDLRLRFAVGEITERSLATTLVKRDNRAAVLVGQQQAYDLVAVVASDVLRQLVRAPRNTIYDLFAAMQRFQQILTFANDQLRETSRSFSKCVVRLFRSSPNTFLEPLTMTFRTETGRG